MFSSALLLAGLWKNPLDGFSQNSVERWRMAQSEETVLVVIRITFR